MKPSVGSQVFSSAWWYHLEYLGRSEAFKNYVSIGLNTRPDRAFFI